MLLDLLNINTVFFTIFGYQMSYVEFFGTIFTGWSVYLAAKNKVLTWPIGILGIVLYGFLFYQIQLYSDLTEQVYYLITGFYGWYIWNPGRKSGEQKIGKNTLKQNVLWLLVILIGSIGMGWFFSNIHLLLPNFFPVPASFPYLDAFTTVMSFVANWLLAKRILESWYLWIVVDIIGVGLYYAKGVPFLALLYLIFLVNAFWGYYNWRREHKRSIEHEGIQDGLSNWEVSTIS